MAEEAMKKKILLVEDDTFMAELLAQELARAGFETSLAKSGKEAIQKFREAAPDLVLLDILLPDVNGVEVLREIKKEPSGASAKVVVLSNLSEGKDVEEAKNLGVVEYLVKANTSLPEISEKVKQILGY